MMMMMMTIIIIIIIIIQFILLCSVPPYDEAPVPTVAAPLSITRSYKTLITSLCPNV
jgi:hypothetical protein